MYTLQFQSPFTWLRTLAVLLAFLGWSHAGQAQCSQPSNLNSNVLSSGTVALSWSAPGGALTYTVQYRKGTSGAWLTTGTVSTTNQVLTGLLPETVYTWRVKANCSTYSSVATFNSGGGVGGNTSCSSPSNLNASLTSTTSATLSWSNIEGALYYTVQYRANNSGLWTTAGSAPGTSLAVTNLQANTNYGWRVKASCSVYSSIALFNTGNSGGGSGGGGSTTCSAPSNTSTTGFTSTSVVAQWEAQGGATNYTVQYRLQTSSTYVTVGTVTTTSVTISGLQPGQAYVWRVKANCSPYGSDVQFSTTGTGGGGGSTTCSAPSNTNTTAITSTSVVAQWEAQGGATNYTVQYRVQTSSTYVTVGTVTGTSATISGLQPGQAYVWRVKANCSPYGSDVQFSTTGTGGGGGGSTTCSAPSNTNTVSVNATSAVVEWEAQGGATSYTVQYRLQTSSVYLTVGTVTGTSMTISGLLPNREYVWRVKANCSPYGSDVQFTTSSLANFRQNLTATTDDYLRLMPNPATTGVVQINVPATGAQLRIFSSEGQVVSEQVLTDTQNTLEVGNWSNGLYFVQVRHANGQVQTTKLVVAH